MTGRAMMGLLLLVAAGCDPKEEPAELPRELTPLENPFGPDDPLYAEQPHRDNPTAIVASPDGDVLYVALLGTESDPGREIAVVDAGTLETLRRVEVGPGPSGMALHPDGRFLVVANRFARYASIVDTRTHRVVQEVDVPYYTEQIAFTPDGRRAFLANRWKDSVLRWEVTADGGDIRIRNLDPLGSPDAQVGIAVPDNPRRLVVTPDGETLLVASESSLSLTAVDVDTSEIVARYSPNSPVVDVAVIGRFVYIAHIGGGTFHPPDDGFDGDEDGERGDGTANVGFQDLQNEIDVLALDDLSRVGRYTSDTICCRDFRDVDPDRPETGLELKPVDAWPPERAAFLPPRETWIVAGAMPERLVEVRRGDGTPALAAVFGGSSEVQTFDVDLEDGSLTPRETAEGGLYETGHGAIDAVAVGGGQRLVVVDKLGETLTAIDLAGAPGDPVEREVVGDVSGGAFPATDAELGEAFNTMTARFTVDGDQTCVHCHRDGSPIGRVVSMPLLERPEWGARLVMSYRNAYDSRPWFLEAGMDESNFFPVINEFARKENFCCEQSDPRVWSLYPSRDECVADESLEGCNHVLRCLDDPPPECEARPYGGPGLTRDQHFRAAAIRVFGDEQSIGDALYTERVAPDGSIERRPINLGFDGITRALGVFLLTQSRELPNPNRTAMTAEARLGEALYHSTQTGCATCHPLPIAATARATVVTQGTGPLSFPYVVSQLRSPEGADVDRANPAFLGTFPDATQTEGGLRVGVTSLRGIWDRTRFLHNGRARSIRETIATPAHPALRPGEHGFNERNGQPDTHGGTSHLSAEELEALVAFVETL